MYSPSANNSQTSLFRAQICASRLPPHPGFAATFCRSSSLRSLPTSTLSPTWIPPPAAVGQPRRAGPVAGACREAPQFPAAVAALLLLLCLAIFGRGQGRPAVGHGGAVVLPASAAARQDARRGGLPASARGEASASASVPGQRLVEHFLVQEQTDCFCCCCRLLSQGNQSITLAAAAADCFFILAIYGAMEMVTR